MKTCAGSNARSLCFSGARPSLPRSRAAALVLLGQLRATGDDDDERCTDTCGGTGYDDGWPQRSEHRPWPAQEPERAPVSAEPPPVSAVSAEHAVASAESLPPGASAGPCRVARSEDHDGPAPTPRRFLIADDQDVVLVLVEHLLKLRFPQYLTIDKVTHACMHACMRACTHTCMHACVRACIRAYVHACIHDDRQGSHDRGDDRSGAAECGAKRLPRFRFCFGQRRCADRR